MSKKIDNTKGPKLFQRDESGLLESHQYIFKEDGSVDWRGMVSEEHLYPNRDWFESRGKEVPNSVAGLEDNQLLIKLAGIRELAKLRGFSSVTYDVEESSDERAVVSCIIDFIPNYENTESYTNTFSSIANATLANTDNFARKFLESIAENRAFVRCVRGFLNIPIVGADEIDKSPKEERVSETVGTANFSPQNTLAKKAAEKGYSDFESFKEKLRELWKDGSFKSPEVKDWKSFNDIGPKEAKQLLGLIAK